MSDVTRRLSRWKAKYSPEIAAQTTARIEGKYEGRSAKPEVRNPAFGTRKSSFGIIKVVFYLDFARQLFKLSHGRTISGPTLAKEAQVLLEKWQSRGLRADVLAAIRTDVFNVPAPAP